MLTAPIAIAADAVTFLLSGLCKARIRTPGLVVSTTPHKQHLRADILEGLRAVFAHRIIRAVTLAATVGALAGQMQNVVLVLYLVRDLGLSSDLVGVVIAIGGLAGILGALLATRITQRLGPGRAFIAGMFLAAIGTQAFGALLGGLLGSALNLRATLIISSGAMLFGTAIAYVSPLRSLRELPAQEVSDEDPAA